MSERRLTANRSNAARSTGPTTARGKARSAANATRHGLNSRAPHSPEAASWIAELAAELIEGRSFLLPSALEMAALLYRLEQVANIRAQTLEAAFGQLPDDLAGLPIEVREAVAMADRLPQLAKLEDYERRNMSLLKKRAASFEVLRRNNASGGATYPSQGGSATKAKPRRSGASPAVEPRELC